MASRKPIVASEDKAYALGKSASRARRGFPDLPDLDDRLRWAFVRGLFDTAGTIAPIRKGARGGAPAEPRCAIASPNGGLLDAIERLAGIPAERPAGRLAYRGTNALDFLGKLYDGAVRYAPAKHGRWLDWCHLVPGLGAAAHPLFRYARIHPDAVPPRKAHASDSGFDLVLIAAGDVRGAVTFYRTGIQVAPAFGWYFDVVPRSSIAKTGYMLANSVGIIDRGYTGEILVPLVKVDPAAPELELPARLVQMVPRPIIAARLVEVDALGATRRGAGGFGSTGR